MSPDPGTDWMRNFDLEFLHEMAQSHVIGEREWMGRAQGRLPWPGTQALREMRVTYRQVHDEERAAGRSCKLCDGD